MNNETETTPTTATPQTGADTPQVPKSSQIDTESQQTTPPHRDMSSIYPTPVEHHVPLEPRQNGLDPDEAATFAQAGQGMNEAVVLITGLLSSACSVLMLYVLKNSWASVICSTILAIIALIFAFKNHRAGAVMSPMSVIGISAATITIVGSLNLLTSQAIIRSMFPY